MKPRPYFTLWNCSSRTSRLQLSGLMDQLGDPNRARSSQGATTDEFRM
jgi:hypothetical protein